MVFDDFAKVVKEDSSFADLMIHRMFWHDFFLVVWTHSPEYPLLYKTKTQHPGEEAHFTPDEKRERQRLCELLLDAQTNINIYYRNQRIQEPHFSSDDLDDFADLYAGLYLLARCNDESAFLELAAQDMSFCRNWFFQESLIVWRQQAGLENRRAQDILKKLSQAIVSPYQLPKSGAPRQITQGICGLYLAIKSNCPDKPDSEIYSTLARESLRNMEKEVDRKAVEREAARIKKEFQNADALFDPRRIIRYKQTGEISPQDKKKLETSRWNRFFQYLRREV